MRLRHTRDGAIRIRHTPAPGTIRHAGLAAASRIWVTAATNTATSVRALALVRMLRDLLLDGVRRAAQRALQSPHMRPLAPPVWRDAEEPGTAAAVIAARAGQDFLQLGRGVEHSHSMRHN